MAIHQKQVMTLQQKLSPQQIQMIKLLELPTVQLEQRIKQEIEENIVLEEEEHASDEEEQPQQISVDEYLREDDTPSYKSRINNYSKEATRRLDWTFGIAYGDDYDRAKRTILEMLEADPRVLKSPAPFVALNSLGDSSVNILARAWVSSGDYWDLFFDMNERVYKRFAEVGLNIPFPQLDVHLKDETRPEEPKRTE